VRLLAQVTIILRHWWSERYYFFSHFRNLSLPQKCKSLISPPTQNK
jgi:hypothetical protein